jgi:hypothetical protein
MFNVSENDFETTVFSIRGYTPSTTTICQWRHDAFVNDKFLSLLYRLASADLHSIVFNWIELELNNEEERNRKDEKKKSIRVQRLYDLSENSTDILIEQVNWKGIVTRMRSEGGFKYFDEDSLKRIWIHRCQHGVKNVWSDKEDRILDELVEQIGYGKWSDIAQHVRLRKSKKSAFMCAQRYMTRMNRKHANR